MSKVCDTCRFWSERVAFCHGCGPMNAMCLNRESLRKSTYTTGRQSCNAWKSGEYGAVDSPGEEGELAHMYAQLDGKN